MYIYILVIIIYHISYVHDHLYTSHYYYTGSVLLTTWSLYKPDRCLFSDTISVYVQSKMNDLLNKNKPFIAVSNMS
jgi:hypothetical protein